MQKLKMGLLGCGRIGLMHAKNIVNLVPNAELVAAADPYLSKDARKTLLELDVANISLDINDVINDLNVEAFFIATPTFTHVEIIRKIIKMNKKPIFCEKPLNISWNELSGLEQEIKAANLKLQVGYNRRFDNNFKTVKNIVDQGQLGKLYMLTITSFDPEPPKAKYVKESGMLWTDMNIHDFDMIRHITGEEIIEVYVSGSNLISEELIGIDVDVSIINLKLSTGTLAVVKTTRKSAYGYDQRLEVLGEKGQVVIDNTRPTTVKIDTIAGRMSENPYHTFIERYPQAYVSEIKEFVNSIIKKQDVQVTISDDIKALKVAFACELSYKQNRVVKLSEVQ